MTTESERESFERLHLEGNKKLARRNEHGDYVLPSINDAWAGFQAAWQARATLGQRQAARDGVTDEMVDKALDAMYEQDWRTTTPDILRKNMRAALQSVEKPVSVPKKANYPKPDPNTGEDKGPCCAHAYADGWNACREAMLSTSPQPQQSVLDLLALIHRDGGHYTGDHGIEKSIQDAFDKIAELRTQQAVPDGWMWFSADLSCLCAANNKNPRAIVGFVRDHAGQTWWHSLPEDEKESVELYIYAEAPSFKEAFQLACDLTKREVAAPAYNGKKEG